MFCRFRFSVTLIAGLMGNQMGSSLDKPSGSPGICPLCHRECRNQITLGCRHRFCQGCIGELWSGSTSGPYFCPECRYEHTEWPEPSEPSGPNPASGVHTSTVKYLLTFSNCLITCGVCYAFQFPSRKHGGRHIRVATINTQAITVFHTQPVTHNTVFDRT